MGKYVKSLHEFLSEDLNKHDIGEPSLNEAFQSGILSTMAKSKSMLKAIQGLSSKGIDLYNIQDAHITRLQAKEAWKYKTDNFIKFWFQGETFAFVTVGNKRVDGSLNPTKSKWSREGNYDFREWTGKDLKNLTNVISIDLNQLPKKNAIKAARVLAKQNTLANMSDKDIKNANLDRYRKTLAEQQFSDGSELDLINNASKYLLTLVETFPALSVIVNPPSDAFYYSYMKDYAKKLLEYIKQIEENSYDIDKVINNEWGRAKGIKGELKSMLQSIKDYNSSYLKQEHGGAEFLKLMQSQGFYNDYKKWLIEQNPDLTPIFEGLEDLNSWCNKNVATMVSGLKMTSIVELEMFADIMYSIGRDFNDLNRALHSLNFIYKRWVEAGRNEATLQAVMGENAEPKSLGQEIGAWSGPKVIATKSDILKRKLEALKKITYIS